MNYLDLYSSYPDHTIAAAWDSQVKEVDKTSWLAETKAYGDELFARFAACYADLRALPRSARRASSDESHAPASWPRSCPNTFSRAGDDYSIGWLGRLPVLHYCLRWDKEWGRRPQSQSRQTILTS